jgi:hypothetical protein
MPVIVMKAISIIIQLRIQFAKVHTIINFIHLTVCVSPCKNCATFTSGTKCTTCIDNADRHVDTEKCICDDRFYEDAAKTC